MRASGVAPVQTMSARRLEATADGAAVRVMPGQPAPVAIGRDRQEFARLGRGAVGCVTHAQDRGVDFPVPLRTVFAPTIVS